MLQKVSKKKQKLWQLHTTSNFVLKKISKFWKFIQLGKKSTFLVSQRQPQKRPPGLHDFLPGGLTTEVPQLSEVVVEGVLPGDLKKKKDPIWGAAQCGTGRGQSHWLFVALSLFRPYLISWVEFCIIMTLEFELYFEKKNQTADSEQGRTLSRFNMWKLLEILTRSQILSRGAGCIWVCCLHVRSKCWSLCSLGYALMWHHSTKTTWGPGCFLIRSCSISCFMAWLFYLLYQPRLWLIGSYRSIGFL